MLSIWFGFLTIKTIKRASEYTYPVIGMDYIHVVKENLNSITRNTLGMEREESKVTVKYQTTLPRKIREHLGVKPGEKVEWHVVRGMVVVDAPRKVKNPVKFLTSQIKLDLDAVKLAREVREEFK